MTCRKGKAAWWWWQIDYLMRYCCMILLTCLWFWMISGLARFSSHMFATKKKYNSIVWGSYISFQDFSGSKHPICVLKPNVGCSKHHLGHKKIILSDAMKNLVVSIYPLGQVVKHSKTPEITCDQNPHKLGPMSQTAQKKMDQSLLKRNQIVIFDHIWGATSLKFPIS